MSAREKSILIGRIADAHGIRGEVLVHSFAENQMDVAAYGPLSDVAGARTFKLKALRVASRGVVCRIEGIADRNAAEALKGTDLYVPRARLPAPEDGAYYHADLVGLRAVSPEGAVLGRVVAVHNFGAGDILEIEIATARHTEMVPFQDAFVPKVDIAAGVVTVILPAAEPNET